MSAPTPPNRWTTLRTRLAGLFSPGAGKSGVNPAVVASVVVGVVLVAALAVWANALTVPVHRAGRPTTSVSPLPERTTATPSPTASGSPTAGSQDTDPEPNPTSSWPRVKASGKFEVAGLNIEAAGSAGKLRRYSVEVETSARLDADKVGRQVAGVLNDPRSWAGSGNIRFALVANPDRADFVITIAAPATAKQRCTPEPSTCLDSGDLVIDASRWKGLPSDYSGRELWQAYLVNHALGHLLGEPHQGCPKKGRPAPVMMPQESAGLDGCTANPWPFA